MYRGKKIGVVVPAYNEEKNIGNTLSEIPDFVDRIYVVDDGSTDKTSEIVKEFAKKDPRIVLIRHEKNQGVGGAIVSGWKKGLDEGMDIMAVLAGDGQMDPSFLSNVLDPIVEEKADISKGTRFWGDSQREMPRIRLIGTFFLKILNKIASGYWHIEDPQNGYVAVSSDALKKINLDTLYKGYAFENDVLVKANIADLRVVNVQVRIRYHSNATSKLKVPSFTVKTSYFLLKSFLWRVWTKYIKKGKLIGYGYLSGFLLILLGTINLFLSAYPHILFAGLIVFLISCMGEKLRIKFSD